MLSALDLSFYPYVASDTGAIWHGIPQLKTTANPTWQWAAALKLTHDGDLNTLNSLIAAGWQRLDSDHWGSGQLNGNRYLRLVSQLGDVRLLKMPGGDDYELWARSEDIRRAEALPVTLAFARVDIPLEDLASAVAGFSATGVATLRVAQMLPPPQFGELALIDHTRDGQSVWQIYTLGMLGDEGLALWQRMGQVLKALAAPAEWWPYTKQLAVCLHGGYAGLREDLRSRLLATRGKEREAWRAHLAELEIDRKHAAALRTARERAQRDPAAWVEQWQEVRQMAADLAALYWAAHQQATAIPATVAEAEAVADIPALAAAGEAIPIPEEARLIAEMVETNAAAVDTTNFAEDRAVRMASLAPKSDWTAEADMPKFKASENLAVYFMGTREQPLSMAEAQAQLLRVSPRTVLTVRIGMALWNLRRHDAKLGKNGQALMSYNEILHLRDVPKHTQAAYPGSGQRVTDGWRAEDRESVRRDFELASRFYLRGKVIVTYRDKGREVNVDDYYVNVGFVSMPDLWGGREHVGVWLGPGAWINSHTEADNYFLAEVDRRVFELHPHHEQHELKIALYLTERWREQARKGNYADPITMAELLQQSVIDVDYKHLTDRFAPRIEHALETLRQRGIALPERLTPVDKQGKRNWGKEWLAARWRIPPPDAIRQSYIDKGITQQARQLPPARSSSAASSHKEGKRNAH